MLKKGYSTKGNKKSNPTKKDEALAEYMDYLKERGKIKAYGFKRNSFEDKLDKIIANTFNNLEGLLLKKEQEHSWEDKDLESLTDEEFIEYEKCQPDYIQSLPGSLRSNDPKELQTRLDAIDKQLEEVDERIDDELEFQEWSKQTVKEAEDENKELQKNIDDYYDALNSTKEKLDKSQSEGLEEASDLLLGWEELLEDRSEGPFPNGYDWLVSGMENLGNEFNKKGILYTDEANSIRELADGVEEYLPIHDTNWSDFEDDYNERVTGLSDELRDFADKYDIDKNPLGDEMFELYQNASNKREWEEKINDNNTIIKRNAESYDESVKIQAREEKKKENLLDNKDKTQARIDYLGSKSEKNKGGI